MALQAPLDLISALVDCPLGWVTDGDNEELQQDENNANQRADANANNLPPQAQQASWPGYAMLGIMTVQFGVQIAQWIKYGVLNRDPKSGTTPPPASNPYTQGLTPDQLKQAQQGLSSWLSLGDSDMWGNLAIVLGNSSFGFSQQQQFYIVYLAKQSKTVTADEKTAVITFDASWPASEQLALAAKLAQQDSIPDMCSTMSSYQYNSKVPPFGASSEVMLVAITTKWPNL